MFIIREQLKCVLRKLGIFIAALFIIVKSKKFQCPLRDEWINKIQHFHAMEYYSVKNTQSIEKCYNMAKTWKHHAKWRKSITKAIY